MPRPKDAALATGDDPGWWATLRSNRVPFCPPTRELRAYRLRVSGNSTMSEGSPAWGAAQLLLDLYTHTGASWLAGTVGCVQHGGVSLISATGPMWRRRPKGVSVDTMSCSSCSGG